MTAMTFGQLRSRLLPGALAVSLLAGACVSDDPSSTGTTSGTDLDSGDLILTSARLRTADSCDALLEHLIAEGVERVGPYGFGGGGYWGPGRFEEVSAELDDAAMAPDGAGDAESGPATTVQASEEGGDFSGTNNQEVNVEEADRVKTDGDRMVILRGDTLEVLDVRGEVPELERSIRLGENAWGSEMFLVGDRVLLLSQSWIDRPFLADDIAIGRPDGSTTSRITEVDLLTGSVEATIEVEGIYLSAREVDGSIRIVTSSPLGNFNFLYPSNPGAEDAATEANRRLVEESTIDQWIPTYRQTVDGDTVAEGRAFDCEDMYLPNEFAGFAALNVLTVDIDDGLRINDSLGVLSDGQTVYASTDRLTVASNRYPEWDWETGEIIGGDDDDYTTSLHNFDITDPGRTEYVASGSVPGSLLSQYSLSEYDGVLRVATTEGSVWGRAADSQSMVTVLEEQGTDLVAIGMVDGLGEGERIFAVRFMGDVAYVVTFRQVDPLYTVDLSEPTDPRVLGELKIPGFSTYLHSVGDGLLLGVGQDASDEGFTTGAQASLFDVSDLSDPIRVDQIGFGQNSYSAVDWDPKAFLYWARRDLVVIPVSAWSYNETTGEEGNSSAAVLVQVNENGTLTELGRIGHPVTSECENYGIEPPESEPRPATDDEVSSDAEADFVQADPPESGSIEPAPEYEEWCWSYQPDIFRSVVIDNSIYTVSDAGVKVNDLDGLETITWVPFARR